jgi:hypothetical protein
MNSLLSKIAGVALLSGGLAIAGVTAAGAQSGRPNSTAMTCGQVQSLINQRGAVVLSTGRHTFDRYVANRNFCQHGEFLKREYVPTRDTPRCYVQRCESGRPFRFND